MRERVYFVRCEATGRTKIGYSSDVDRRVAEMQIGASSTLTLLGSVVGGAEKEREIHDALSSHRLHGEWFDVPPAKLRQWLRAIEPHRATIATPGVLTLDAASAATGGAVPVATLRMWAADGRLRTTKPGRRVLVTRRALADALGVEIEDLP